MHKKGEEKASKVFSSSTLFCRFFTSIPILIFYYITEACVFSCFPFAHVFAWFFYYFHGRKCVWNNNFTSLFIHTPRRRPRMCSPHMIFRLFESVPRALSFSRSKHRQLRRRRRHGMEIARLLFITTHLQFGFGHVDLPPVHKFDDELKVSECHLWRHDNYWMLAGILYE